MRKLGDLMNELGFNPNSREATAEAFIKNLMKSAYGVELKRPEGSLQEAPVPQQLSFAFEETLALKPMSVKKKGA